MRDAPSRVLIGALWASGAKVQAFDPEAMEEAQRIYGVRDELVLCGTQNAVLKEADALVICTEWKQFWAPDFSMMKSLLKEPLVFDGRNLFDPEMVIDHGFTYLTIGRG